VRLGSGLRGPGVGFVPAGVSDALQHTSADSSTVRSALRVIPSRLAVATIFVCVSVTVLALVRRRPDTDPARA
jgi:hypothetical protein